MKTKKQFIAMATQISMICAIAIIALALTVCKEDEPPTHTHQWAWTITKPATYTETGEEIQKCSCGATNETRPIPKKIALNTELADILDTLSPNTAETPYTIELNLSNNDDVSSLKEILDAAPDKFVILDLSGSTITEIPDFAFIDIYTDEGCATLVGITIPNSVTSIGIGAFYFCTNLASVNIPNNVTGIGWGTFSYCTSLTSITIPDNVTNIDNRAFAFCDNLASITISNNVTNIGERAFERCPIFTSITIPKSVTSLGNYAFDCCTSLISVTFSGNNIANFGSNVFPEGIDGFGENTLKNAYNAASSKEGTYTREANGSLWTKQP